MQFRAPAFPWIITSLIGALGLHGLAWFVARILSVPLEEALHETQRQVTLSLFWQACAIAIWSIQLPKSRLSALFQVLACAFVVCVLGSVVAFFNWMVSENIGLSLNNLLPFTIYALLMLLAQLFLALPSAALLQQLLLVPQRAKAG